MRINRQDAKSARASFEACRKSVRDLSRIRPRLCPALSQETLQVVDDARLPLENAEASVTGMLAMALARKLLISAELYLPIAKKWRG